MKRRMVSILLVLALVLTSGDFSAFATEQTDVVESVVEKEAEKETCSAAEEKFAEEGTVEQRVTEVESEDILSEESDLDSITQDIEKTEIEDEETISSFIIEESLENEIEETTCVINNGTVNGSYKNIIWEINTDGKLTVNGTGDISDSYTSPHRAPWYDYRTSIISAEINVDGMKCANALFYGCNNLRNLNLSGFDTGKVTAMESMFYDCVSLTNLNLSSFNTENVTDMSSMFYNCVSLTHLDISSFNTKNVIDMKQLFGKCSNLTNLDISNFKTDNVTNMSGMFYDCSSLETLDVSNFDTKNVSNMDFMFWGCGNLTNLDLSNFNTENVINMANMFSGCSSLQELNIYNFNTENVTNMSQMFHGCTYLLNLNVSNFKTENVINMSNMFCDCSSLQELDISNFNTKNVTDMSWMFGWCSSLQELDISNFNIENVTDISYTFYHCSNLQTLDLSYLNACSVTEGTEMLIHCDSLELIFTPCNLKCNISLPRVNSTDVWYFSDGIASTELPQNLDYSVAIGKNYIPTEKSDDIYINENNNHKYKLFDMSMEWEKAKEYCENLGGHLLTITTKEEQQFVTAIAEKSNKKNIWLGAEIVSGEFSWITGEEFVYTNWNGGEPNNINNNQNTIMMYTYYGTNNNGYSITPGVWNDESKQGRNWPGYTLNDTGFICEWDDEISKEENNSIIEVVSRYTNQEEVAGCMALFDDLRNHNYSDKEAQKKIFEYFCCDNWTSVFEQITLLQDSHDERWAYNGLITDEMYIAWQYQNYLNNTTKGKLARAALWSSGLVFNGELNDYLDLGTYLNSDLPGIKDYKSMLQEFIGERTAQIETYSYIKETEKILQSTVGVWSDLQKENVLKKLKKAGDKETCKTIFNNFVAEKKDSLKELVVVTKGDTPKFIEALEITGDIFTITDMSVDFATQMADVSANIEVYETWHSFLVEISNAKDLPWEMRAAAYQLDKEMEQTYLTPMMNVFNKVRDKCINKALSATVWKDIVSLGGYTDTLDIAASIINTFVDVGALIVNSKKTEGYAYLANHYKTKLQNCKTAFLNYKSTENAWEFYESYVMLHSLRVAGEEQFLKMSRLQGNDVVDGLSECATGGTIGGLISDLCGYQDKKACVDEILKRLETFKFQYDLNADSVPEEYKYLQKVVVECPVSVEFLTDNGTSIYKLEDKTEYDTENEYGHFRAFYNPADGDYIKIGYFKSLNPVKVVAIGQEDGDVTYTQAVTNDNITCDITGFAKQKVITDEVIKINTAENTYVIDIKGDGKTVVEAPKADASKTFVQFDYDDSKTIEIKYTDSEGRVQIPDAPQKENAVFLGWYTEKNGNGDVFTEQSIVTSSITVYAHWSKEQEDNLEKLLTPVSDHESGSSIRQGTCITLSSEENAIIYYTVDGTIPMTDSLLYSRPIVVNTDITIKAIAVKEGYKNSDIATFVYTIAQGQYYTVTFNSNGGTDIAEQNVQENGKATEPPAPTREGYIFTGWYLNGVLYDFNTEVTVNIVLEAGWSEIGKVATPTPSIASGSTVASGTRLRLISSEDAKIYYTLDETIPTVSSTPFKEDILITRHTVIKAFAVKEGFKDSDIATFIYDISASDNPDEMGDVLPEDIPPTGIPNGLWIAGVNDVTYTGKAIKPYVRVYDYKTRLTEKRDYSISYKNNINANNAADESKAPSVIIKAKGNYSGKETATFKILPIDINSIGFVIEDIAVNPNQKVQKPIPEVTYNGKKLSNKKDFTVTYPDTSANAYKEKGKYVIKITGQGNYAGEKTINLLITDNILITKAKVSKISTQQYTGKALTPTVQVKYGKTVLKQGTDYELTYQNNVKIGIAYAVIKGKGGYSGQKAVPFQITGMAINKATVTGLDTPTAFNGTAITKNITLAVTVDGSRKTLKAGQDYTVIYQNNKNAGTATVIFTGINGYSGTLKKTFKINPYDLQTDTDKKISYNKKLSVPYAKDGSCPEPVIYFNNTKLKKDRDYSLNYKNNKAVNSGISPDTAPVAVVKGKGNFKGTLSIPFAITSQDISNLTLTASDKEYKNRANIFATNITVTDTNGKALSAGKDYVKSSIVYTYANAVKLENGVSKKAGAVVEKTDFIPAGTRIQVSVTAKAGGYYTGTAKGIYRIIKSDIKKAKVSIPVQTYTGEAIIPKKSDIAVTVGGTKLTESEFEIVSCTNNIKKGNATITIKGKGNYGGTKTIRFKIQSKGFLWWWRK